MVVIVSVLVLVEVERLLDEEAVRGVSVVVGVMVGVVAVPRGLVLLVGTSVHLKTILDGTSTNIYRAWLKGKPQVA